MALALLLLLGGCDDMIHQAKRNPYETYAAPAPPTPGQPAPGAVGFETRPVPPPKLTLALLQRGQAEYRQFCVPCHSELGDGNGTVPQRGFAHPPAYTQDKVLHAPTQHYYDVLTNGFGQMYSFAQRIAPEDRWAIAAYIRALQASAQGKPTDLSPEQQASLATAAATGPSPSLDTETTGAAR